MNNCIFSPHCIEQMCDKSCPILTEISYLMERNNISMKSSVLKSNSKDINSASEILSKINELDNNFGVVVCNDTISVSNLLTYCAICKNWQGNRLHCNVYSLKFSNYIDAIQKSWSVNSTPESLEYEQIWVNTSKILIISCIDFVQFKDFSTQTLLNIIHERMEHNLTTIIVSPKLSTLVGSGQFFNRMQTMFGKAVIKWQ